MLKVKEPVPLAVTVCAAAPSTKSVTVALGSPIPLMIFVPFDNKPLTGEVIVGTTDVPAITLPDPLPT